MATEHDQGLSEERFARQFMSEWGTGKRIYKEFKAKDRTAAEDRVCKRHLLNLVTNEQYILAVVSGIRLPLWYPNG